MKRLIIIDAHALIHRAYHALPPLSDKKGRPTNAVYGFASIFLKMVRDLKPDYIVAAFDRAEPTFRDELFAEYKAHRPAAPDDLYEQVPLVKKMLEAFRVPVLEKAGFEADDIIGTLAEKAKRGEFNSGLEVLIVTGDLDTLQLVGKEVKVYTLRKGVSDTVIYDEKAVRERYGLAPAQLIDYKALRGDPSDNIPGVGGIGEKTASVLIAEFDNLENLYKEIKKFSAADKKEKAEIKPILTPRIVEKLTAGKDAAFFSRDLVTICRDVPVDFSPEEARWDKFSREEVLKYFQELGFGSLISRFNALFEAGKNDAELPKPQSARTQSGKFLTETEFIKAAHAEGKILFYFLTSGENLFGAEARLYFSPRPEGVFAVSRPSDDLFEAIKNKNIKKIGYDLKSIAKHINKDEKIISWVSGDFDLMLASYLADAGNNQDLEKILVREFGAAEKLTPENVFATINFLWQLTGVLDKKLEKAGLKDIFKKIEMPLIDIIFEMEKRGIKVNSRVLEEASFELDGEIKKLEKKIYELAGGEFLINSPSRLSRVLFEKLKISSKGLRKTPGGIVSTRASELAKLSAVHPIIGFIGEYRESAKLKSTYADALQKLIASDGRIHTTFHQAVTATGRLSSSEPNLQNLPIRTEAGRKIREAFEADNGYLFAAFDYSQIELRIVASISGDVKMIRAFERGDDIHTLTAAEIGGVNPDKVTHKMRRAAKAVNFGVIYGMSATGLAESVGISRGRSKEFIDNYFDHFQGVKKYIESVTDFARRRGYVETLLGRRRYLPDIKSTSFNLRQAAERMAINMPVQGTAADIVKLAMIAVDKKIKGKYGADEARLLLQVHDELLFEIKKDKMEEITPIIKEEMEKVFALRVPLVVDVKTGKNWGEL